MSESQSSSWTPSHLRMRPDVYSRPKALLLADLTLLGLFLMLGRWLIGGLLWPVSSRTAMTFRRLSPTPAWTASTPWSPSVRRSCWWSSPRTDCGSLIERHGHGPR